MPTPEAACCGLDSAEAASWCTAGACSCNRNTRSLGRKTIHLQGASQEPINSAGHRHPQLGQSRERTLPQTYPGTGESWPQVMCAPSTRAIGAAHLSLTCGGNPVRSLSLLTEVKTQTIIPSTLTIADEDTEAQSSWVLSRSHTKSSSRVGPRNPNSQMLQDSVCHPSHLLCVEKHPEE